MQRMYIWSLKQKINRCLPGEKNIDPAVKTTSSINPRSSRNKKPVAIVLCGKTHVFAIPKKVAFKKYSCGWICKRLYHLGRQLLPSACDFIGSFQVPISPRRYIIYYRWQRYCRDKAHPNILSIGRLVCSRLGFTHQSLIWWIVHFSTISVA